MNQARCALPLALPDSGLERALLVMLRRMAIHGLADAQAAMVAIDHFGGGFRKPLVLLRCYLHELAQASQRHIRVAPCCAPRMGADEALMLEGILAPTQMTFAALTDCDEVSRVHSTAIALRRALQPFELRQRGGNGGAVKR